MSELVSKIHKRYKDGIAQNGSNAEVEAVSPAPTPTAAPIEASAPALDIIKSVPAQENIQNASTEVKPVDKFANKPTGLTDGDYEHLLKFYTPEAISKGYAPFDPSKNDNFLQRMYEMSVPAPAAPDQKKIKNAKLIGSIADAVGTLGQMWSAGKGAHIRPREYSQSASSQLANEEKSLTNLYLNRKNRYDEGRYNARLKDTLQGKADYDSARKGIQAVLTQKQKLDQVGELAKQKQQNWESQLDYNKEKDSKAQELAKGKLALDRERFGESIRHNKSMEGQGWARVADAKDRTAAYVKNLSVGGKNGYQMMFEANPVDKDAQKDQFGNDVKVFQMTKGEVDQYARQALTDKQFMAKHPELILQKPDMLGSGTLKYKPNSDIAAAYLKEQYEDGFKQAPSATPNYWQGAQASGIPGWDASEDTPPEADEWDAFEMN